MAVLVLTDVKTYGGSLDLSSDLNKITVNVTADEVESTRFGSGGARTKLGGLKSADISHDGYANFPDPDSTMFTGQLGNERVFTISPNGTDGDVAYFCNATRFNYVPLDGQVGEMAAFHGEVSSSDKYGMIRGRLLSPKGGWGIAGQGSGVQLGAVSATQKLFTAIHVFTAGTTIDVIVESDDNSGFTTPTTRSTTTLTATGGTFVTPVAGAITDTYWRVRFANVTGSTYLAVAVGIQ